MIIIWDNGGSYSQHCIAFIDIGDVPVEQAERLILAQEGGEIVGRAESVEWFARDPAPLSGFLFGPWEVLDFAAFEPQDRGVALECIAARAEHVGETLIPGRGRFLRTGETEEQCIAETKAELAKLDALRAKVEAW